MDLGANLRGVDMGPSALRIAGIAETLSGLGHEVVDHGQVPTRSRVELDPGETSAKFAREVAEVCERLAGIARATRERDAIGVFLGGDHSLAIGTVGGVAAHHRDRGERIGLIWFDAHADMNTPETSPSGNVHGMPLAALLGRGDPHVTGVAGEGAKLAPENVVIVGARDIDAREREIVRAAGVHVFSMTEIDTLGMAEVTRRALALAGDGTAGIHLSFDIDGLDPSFAPGVGTPVRGGISYREAHLFMELVSSSGQMIALDIVELNPVKDMQNGTAESVVQLVASAFGQRIF